MNTEAMIWFALALIFLLVEANTVAVVSAWFCVGALAAMVAAILHAPVWLEIVIFIVVSGALLAAFRPLVKKHFNAKVEKTNVDAIIGTMGKVLTPIDNIQSTGQVKLGGMEWTARSTTGQSIPAGTIVKVDRIEGVKVFVTPAEETVSTK